MFSKKQIFFQELSKYSEIDDEEDITKQWIILMKNRPTKKE